MASDQEPYESVTRVFWIKIELQENQPTGTQVLGEIRDVISGEKSSIKYLFDIIYFIIPYIEKMGIQINLFWRFMAFIDLFFTQRKKIQSQSNTK